MSINVFNRNFLIYKKPNAYNREKWHLKSNGHIYGYVKLDFCFRGIMLN